MPAMGCGECFAWLWPSRRKFDLVASAHGVVRQRLQAGSPRADPPNSKNAFGGCSTPGGGSPARSGGLDIASLLFCPDPSRALGKHYRIEQHLGSGGFGAVYRATHLLTKEDRAIKQVEKSDVQDDMKCVYTELEALARLDHPNIVKFHEFFEDANMLYLVTEMCSAGDFSDLNHGIDDPLEIRLLFRDLLLAVGYCHGLGIAHRDLKFENCLLDKRPHQRYVCKVIDFGLSAIRRLEDEDDKWLNDQLGTKFFIAPEVIDHCVMYGVSCDMWSIGVMLYIVLTDEHPFSADALSLSIESLFSRVRTRPWRLKPLDDARADKVVRDLIGKLLEKDPALRMCAQDALHHDWIAGAIVASADWRRTAHSWRAKPLRRMGSIRGTSAIDSEMAARLHNFGRCSKFERAVLTLAAHHTSTHEVEDLRSAFMELDTTKNGTLSMDEIREAFRKCGHKISEEDLDHLFVVLDANETGKIHYTEWLAATLKPTMLASDLAIDQLFNFFDIEGNGRVSKEELLQVFEDPDHVDDLLMRADTSGDGMLDKQEFKVLIESIAESFAR